MDNKPRDPPAQFLPATLGQTRQAGQLFDGAIARDVHRREELVLGIVAQDGMDEREGREGVCAIAGCPASVGWGEGEGEDVEEDLAWEGEKRCELGLGEDAGWPAWAGRGDVQPVSA